MSTIEAHACSMPAAAWAWAASTCFLTALASQAPTFRPRDTIVMVCPSVVMVILDV